MFGRLTRRCARLVGHPAYLALNILAAAAALAGGILTGKLELWMLSLTTGFTISTQIQSVLQAHQQDADTKAVKAQLAELGRAVPGAREVIKEK